MADLSDVLHALRDAVAAALYPAGVPAGARPASVAGPPVRVFVGWPDETIDADLAAGICLVTVWTRAGERVLGPYLQGWEEAAPRAAPSLAAAAAGDTVTFAGDASVPGMVAALLAGRLSWAHAVLPGEGPAEVAAALAAAASADVPGASAAGAAVTLPGAGPLAARVFAGGAERREVRRVVADLVLSAWCPSPALRDAVARAADAALLGPLRLPMADGTTATVRYEGSVLLEEARKQPLHRRDLLLSAEYSADASRAAPPVVVPAHPVDARPV